MIQKETLKKLSTWGGLMGWLTAISGGLCCLSLIYIIPGVMNIVLAIKLLKAKKCADNLLLSENINENEVNALIDNIGSYFKIAGIFTIIAFLIAIIAVIVCFSLGIFSSMR